MRASQWFFTTLRDVPKDAEIASHQLMLRAGMIKKLGSGLYTWLPLGLRVLRNIERIVREEMNRAGAAELLMPAIQPAELWKETERWESFGNLLLKMTDSSQREYCFGPTHEEVITDIVRNEAQSYKQLPLSFYQIQTKFRDEIRPRFGVMRAREFIMKDAYSFHINEESLQQTYQIMYNAYCRIFDRLGLSYRAVEADTGAIGGAASHEFQVLAESGEDLIFYSDQSDYAANIEQAVSLPPKKQDEVNTIAYSRVSTPNKKTISDVAHFLKVEPHQMVKTLIVEGKEQPYIALVLRADDELNEIKASKHPLIKSPLTFVKDENLQTDLSIPTGFIGPVGLSIPVIADYHAANMARFICGANEADTHLIDVSWERDTRYHHAYDLRNVKTGDASPDGQGQLKSCRGIEVGHIFQLGDKYSKAMHAEVVNEEGRAQTLLMGCYGIGVSRIAAAAIEQHHDEKGIIWPLAIAPFQLVIIPINAGRCPEVKAVAEDLYQKLTHAGIEVLLDDRQERPGVLFADHDLIGIPHRLVISDRHLQQQEVEYKARNSESSENLPLADIGQFFNQLLSHYHE